MLNRLIDRLFGCSHRHLGAWHADTDGDYQRCMDCGARCELKLDDVVKPLRLPRIKPLKGRQMKTDWAKLLKVKP